VYVAVKDFVPSNPDELELRKGTLVQVEKKFSNDRGRQYWKGRLKDGTDPFSSNLSTGWFPAAVLAEAPSARRESREVLQRKASGELDPSAMLEAASQRGEGMLEAANGREEGMLAVANEREEEMLKGGEQGGSSGGAHLDARKHSGTIC
jgi:hypothetical protein